jgi:branched-chain amino acid transport system substrate-binding protein
MKRWLSVLLAALVLVAMIPVMGCAGEDTYKVGAVFAVSGFMSGLGEPEKQTVEMMVDQINEAGGINGRDLEVIVYDTESDTTKCVTMIERLIEQDDVLAIIGPSGSGTSNASITTVTAAKIPLVSCAASIDIVTPIADRYWVFKTPQTEVQAIREIYAHLEDEGITQVALITDTSGFGAAGRTYLMSLDEDYGITILEDETFASGDTSMQTQLTVIKGKEDVEAVICWATDQESAVVAQDMQTLQMEVPLFCSHGIANMDFITNAGEAANGVIFPAGKLLVIDDVPASDPQKDVLTQYKSDFEALYGAGTVNTFGGHAYDALSMVVMAIEASVDTLDDLSLAQARAKIRDEIEEIEDFAGTGGVFTMSATDHLGMAEGSLALIEIVDGEWTWLQ